MTLRTKLPNRCKHCKQRMPADKARHVLHDECIEPWLAAQNEKKARKAEKEKRHAQAKDGRETKEKLEKHKRRGDLLSEAQTAFNKFIRLRDTGQTCICCGKPFELQRPGGSVDAGHYLSRGSAPHLRFDERNVHAQRKNCNRPGGTTREAFRAGMIQRMGREAVESLECDQSLKKYTNDDLRAIKATYTAKARELQKALE